MIELQNIRKIYSLGEEEVRALDGVSLSVQDHEFVAIVGASGSGKSTLMNIIGCLDTPDEGSYYIDGQDVTSLSERELATMRNRKIGFIFQQFNLLPKLTAYENVELPLIYQGLPARERRERTEQALERVGLGSRLHHRPNQLSGGQQQRVAVARALATHPSLILADEPTGNLDSKSSRDIMGLIHELHEQGNTIILITHDESIAATAERQVRLMDGRIVADSAHPAPSGRRGNTDRPQRTPPEERVHSEGRQRAQEGLGTSTGDRHRSQESGGYAGGRRNPPAESKSSSDFRQHRDSSEGRPRRNASEDGRRRANAPQERDGRQTDNDAEGRSAHGQEEV